jgi:hypothetical protein
MTETRQLSDLAMDFDTKYKVNEKPVEQQEENLAEYHLKYCGPLWQRIGGKTGPYDLGPGEIASILRLIADEAEHRGEIDYDRDPGETVDWLRSQAMIAESAIGL